MAIRLLQVIQSMKQLESITLLDRIGGALKKNYKKFLIILLCIILLIIIFSLGYLLGKKEEIIMRRNDGINTATYIITDDGTRMENVKCVSGLLASYKYIDRDL